MNTETNPETLSIAEVEEQIIKTQLIGKPIYDVLRRQQIAQQYADGEVSKEEYEAFVAYYNIRMQALSSKLFNH